MHSLRRKRHSCAAELRLIEDLQRGLGRSPRDGTAVEEEDVADKRQADVGDVGEGSVRVTVDDAWEGIVQIRSS